MDIREFIAGPDLDERQVAAVREISYQSSCLSRRPART